MSEIPLDIEVGGKDLQFVLQKDTQVYRRVDSKNRNLARYGILQEGCEIIVGNPATPMVLLYDHRMQFYVPWLDDPLSLPEDEASVSYINVLDLPFG